MAEQAEDLPMGLVITDDGTILNWQGVNYLRQDTATEVAATMRDRQLNETLIENGFLRAEVERMKEAQLAVLALSERVRELQETISSFAPATAQGDEVESPDINDTGDQMSYDGRVWIAADALPRVDMYEPEDGIAEIDGVVWIPSAELDTVREEEETAAAAQQDRLEALRRSHEFIAVQEPETRVSASLLLSAVRWVLTGQVDD